MKNVSDHFLMVENSKPGMKIIIFIAWVQTFLMQILTPLLGYDVFSGAILNGQGKVAKSPTFK